MNWWAASARSNACIPSKALLRPPTVAAVSADLQGLRRGTVTLATVESAARGLVPEVLAGFWVRHPEITVDVHVGSSTEAAEAVAQGDADLAILFDLRAPRTTRRVASISVPMGVMVAPGSRLATKGGVLRVYDLNGERVILSDTSLTLGSTIEARYSPVCVP